MVSCKQKMLYCIVVFFTCLKFRLSKYFQAISLMFLFTINWGIIQPAFVFWGTREFRNLAMTFFKEEVREPLTSLFTLNPDMISGEEDCENRQRRSSLSAEDKNSDPVSNLSVRVTYHQDHCRTTTG